MIGGAVATNVRYELLRLRRSQRIFLWLIPPIAGPIGSAVSDLYLKLPSPGQAEVLGLLVEAGLTALILIDLVALAAGEELARRAHLVAFALPQSRPALLAARLLPAIGGTLAGYLVGASAILLLAPALVTSTPGAAAPLFAPASLAIGLLGLLLLLAGVAAVTAVQTRSASEPIVAAILAGVVTAGGGGYLVAMGEMHWEFPLVLGVAGVAAVALAAVRYGQLEG
jgi:hypothetical protein